MNHYLDTDGLTASPVNQSLREEVESESEEKSEHFINE